MVLGRGLKEHLGTSSKKEEMERHTTQPLNGTVKILITIRFKKKKNDDIYLWLLTK